MSNKPVTILPNFPSSTDFLTKYWGKRPLLIRNAWPDAPSPITPDELAGLACEQELASRFVQFHPRRKRWLVDFGPFDQQFFAKTPKRDWSLLVNDVDSLIPEVAQLWDRLPAIPYWRRDDIMVNYAVDGGNVGPHLDNYDVFLYQASGIKHWSIENGLRASDQWQPDQTLRILPDFRASHSWDVNPGDILYLPARFPHYGIAKGAGLTYSFGFRAPALGDALAGAYSMIADRIEESARLTEARRDPLFGPNLGELDDRMAEHTLTTLSDHQINQDDVQLWLGKALSSPMRQALPNRQQLAPAKVLAKLAKGKSVIRDPRIRVFYCRRAKGVTVFAGGDAFLFPSAAGKMIAEFCNAKPFAALSCSPTLTGASFDFILTMLNLQAAFIA